MSLAMIGFFHGGVGPACHLNPPHLQLLVLVGEKKRPIKMELSTEAVNWEWKRLQSGNHVCRAQLWEPGVAVSVLPPHHCEKDGWMGLEPYPRYQFVNLDI